MSKLEEFLDDNAIYYHSRENSVTIVCPNCQKEKLDIHKSELNYICYYCADHSNPVRGPNATKLLSDISGINYGIVKRKLSGFVSLTEFAESMNQSFSTSPQVIKPVITEKIITLPEYALHLNAHSSKSAVDYLLNKRGIPVEIAIKYNLKYDYKRKEIVFPVYDGEKLVGYQTRSVDPTCPKAFQKMTLKGFDKSDFLMFENSIHNHQAILAEGPISALKFAHTSIGFVASMGKYVSEKQMLRLRDKGVKQIFLALDVDAFNETKKLMLKFEHLFEFYLLQLLDSTKEELKNVEKPDIGDCNFKQIDIISIKN